MAVGGTDAAMFTVGTQPSSPIGSFGNTTFTITFTPTSAGVKTATVTIANDDADENPYTFTLTGVGVVGARDQREAGPRRSAIRHRQPTTSATFSRAPPPRW